MSSFREIDKRIRIDNVAQSDVKLTNLGKKYSKMSEKELSSLLVLDKIILNDEVSLNTLIGVASNPNLNTDLILQMYKILNSLSKKENSSKDISKATKTKNSGLRAKIRRLLSQHPNLSDDVIEKLLVSPTSNSKNVLKNPSIKEKHLQLYFDKIVLRSGTDYSFLDFNSLSKAANVTENLMKKWYSTLVKYADWTYSDNHWYSIVESFLDYPDLWEDILIDIAGAPKSVKMFSDIFRDQAVRHKNATDNVSMKAYEITGEEIYLPKLAKNIFSF